MIRWAVIIWYAGNAPTAHCIDVAYKYYKQWGGRMERKDFDLVIKGKAERTEIRFNGGEVIMYGYQLQLGIVNGYSDFTADSMTEEK